MKEFEYSFKTNDIKPVLDFCDNNGYIKKQENAEIRELFKCENGILARITTTICDNKTSSILDFKDDKVVINEIKEARESIPIEVTEENRQGIDSMLEILGYKKDKTLKRNRLVYEKADIKFEIDLYQEPEVCNVVAIEGNKDKIELIYDELMEHIKNKEN